MAEVGTTILDGIGAMVGTSKVKALEQQNKALHEEVATHEETIEMLQTKITTMQNNHNRELTVMQARYATETANLTKQHAKEVLLLNTVLSKAIKWIPYFREMIRMESICQTIGFDNKQITTLIKGKLLEYSGELYSETHRYKFKAENIIARISPDEIDNRKLILKIDGLPIITWFKEQMENLCKRMGIGEDEFRIKRGRGI